VSYADDDRDVPSLRAGTQTACPPPAELLLAVHGTLTGSAISGADAWFDDLARRLFGTEGGEPAERLAGLLVDPGLRLCRCEPAGLLLDQVIARRAGHPLLLAVVLAEAGRRAGHSTGVFSAPAGWYAGMQGSDRAWLIDLEGRAPHPATVRSHCSHEIAYAALTGLHRGYLRVGDLRQARAAWALRGQLPVDPRPGLDLDGDGDLLGIFWDGE
jgi:hypothetical protein